MKDLSHNVAAASSSLPWYRMSLSRLFRVNVALCCILALFVWLDRIRISPSETARQSQCVNNLKQIGLALRGYHAVYGSFPPAHINDANGKPMHSWRVLILPFMDQSPLYSMYNFNEPWNGPADSKLIATCPSVYICPSRHDYPARACATSYVVVTGPGTIFPDSATVMLSEIKDGDASTIIAVEVVNVDIPWTEPRDLDLRTMSFRFNDPNRAGISCRHPGGPGFSLADAQCRRLRKLITPQQLSALFSINGQEPLDMDAMFRRW